MAAKARGDHNGGDDSESGFVYPAFTESVASSNGVGAYARKYAFPGRVRWIRGLLADNAEGSSRFRE